LNKKEPIALFNSEQESQKDLFFFPSFGVGDTPTTYDDQKRQELKLLAEFRNRRSCTTRTIKQIEAKDEKGKLKSFPQQPPCFHEKAKLSR